MRGSFFSRFKKKVKRPPDYSDHFESHTTQTHRVFRVEDEHFGDCQDIVTETQLDLEDFEGWKSPDTET